MRKVFDSLSHINLQERNSHLFLPVNSKIHVYSDQMEKTTEISYDDEILNFHILSGSDNIVTIGKNNKKVSLKNVKGELIAE